MRKVTIIEEEIREIFEQKLEYALSDNEMEIVELKYGVSDTKYTALIIYRKPASVG